MVEIFQLLLKDNMLSKKTTRQITNKLIYPENEKILDKTIPEI